MTTKPLLHLMLGLDQDGKPRAAIVSVNDLSAATKAAKAMGLRIAQANTPYALALAKGLPQVKLFATGKGLVPLIKKDAYELLLKALTFVKAEPSQGMPSVPQTAAGGDKQAEKPTPVAVLGKSTATVQPGPSAPPDPWQAIAVGHVVLWQVDPKEGWFPTIVTASSKDGKKLTLKWRDFSGFKPFDVPRRAVGLLSSPK